MIQCGTMKFTKMHGAGNDYVLVDARHDEADWSSLANSLCDRHYGVGADGLLLVAPSLIADIRMRMFNPDGSEAQMCGNGLRCFSKYVLERGVVDIRNDKLRVETSAGVLSVEPLSENGYINRARVEMGEPRFHAHEIPFVLADEKSGLFVEPAQLNISDVLRDDLDVDQLVVNYPLEIDRHSFKTTCVSMGNPHAVAFFMESVDDVPLHLLGPLVEHHPLFPERVNFQIVNVDDRGHMKARTWERGAGLTKACGTAACATAVSGAVLKLSERCVDIEFPEGLLNIDWRVDNNIYMKGKVSEVEKIKVDI